MCSNNLTFRLKQEIESLKGGVTTAAEHLNKSRNTIYNWFEKGNAPVDQVEKLKEIGVDLSYVFMGVRSPESGVSARPETHNKIHEKSFSYGNLDKSVERNMLDERLATVINNYIHDDIVATITATLAQALDDKELTIDNDTQARLIAAALEGHEQLRVSGRVDKFDGLLLSLIEATLVEKNI